MPTELAFVWYSTCSLRRHLLGGGVAAHPEVSAAWIVPSEETETASLCVLGSTIHSPDTSTYYVCIDLPPRAQPSRTLLILSAVLNLT